MNMEIALFMAHLCLIVPALYDYPDVSCQDFRKLAQTLDIFSYSFFQLENRQKFLKNSNRSRFKTLIWKNQTKIEI